MRPILVRLPIRLAAMDENLVLDFVSPTTFTECAKWPFDLNEAPSARIRLTGAIRGDASPGCRYNDNGQDLSPDSMRDLLNSRTNGEGPSAAVLRGLPWAACGHVAEARVEN